MAAAQSSPSVRLIVGILLSDFRTVRAHGKQLKSAPREAPQRLDPTPVLLKNKVFFNK
jgi:hypothetical protein